MLVIALFSTLVSLASFSMAETTVTNSAGGWYVTYGEILPPIPGATLCSQRVCTTPTVCGGDRCYVKGQAGFFGSEPITFTGEGKCNWDNLLQRCACKFDVDANDPLFRH